MIKAEKDVKEKMDKALEKALKNKSLKNVYEKAPSEECKDYLAYTFYSSEYYDPDVEDVETFDRIQDQVESRLAAEDWKYLKKLSPNSPFVGYCDQKIKELS